MKSQISVAVIGLGCRGMMLMRDIILPMEGVRITGLCDLYQDRLDMAADAVKQAGSPRPFTTDNWRAIIKKKPDAVVIATSWIEHIPIAVACLEAGIAVGCEVGGTADIQECWDLVAAYERTGTPVMMLENCCYGRDELMIANMVRHGAFGRLVHCEGGYRHDLREEVTGGWRKRHYRLDHYLRRNADNYPTHALGPIAQLLGIGRGNTMESLYSVSSLSAGLEQYINDQNADPELTGLRFKQGDVITTTIRCSGGETVILTLDTTLPRPYSRGLVVQGTLGMFQEDTGSVFIDQKHNAYDFKWKEQWGNVEEFRAAYEHPIWRQYLKAGPRGGHGGMDWLVLTDFFRRLREGLPMPVDVYDMAAWMSVTALSAQSIATGSAVPVPDFTKGRWVLRKSVELDWMEV